jgi:hypothetical protein
MWGIVSSPICEWWMYQRRGRSEWSRKIVKEIIGGNFLI